MRTQSFYLFDDRLAEVVAGLADDEERILRAAGCREVAAVVLYQVEQRIFVQIVVVETDRQVGRLMSEETCHHIVFAIIIKYIGHIAALLQHVAAAGEIVGPCSGLFSPRLMAVEPLSVEVQSESGAHVVQWLMGTLVYNKAVGTVGHFKIGRRF